MPRSPVIATQPPGTTPQVPNTTIQSAVWNAAIDDIYNIFNTIQPIEFGGTGETSARLPDGTWRFKNTADPTKLLALDLSALSTATTRTITMGDANVTLRPYARELIDTTTITSGAGLPSLGYTNLSDYNRIYITGYCSPSADNVSFILRTSTNNGTSYDSGASDYDYQVLRGTGVTASSVQTTGFSSISIGGTSTLGNAANQAISFEVCLENFNGGFYMFSRIDSFGIQQDGTYIKSSIGGRRLSAVGRNAVQLAFTAGNVLRCKVTVEGVRG